MRTALVTGVSQGLGYHTCQSLKAAGYRVLGVGRAAEPGNDAVDAYESVDLTTAVLPDLFTTEHVDVLVNNAAVYWDDPRHGSNDVFDLRPEDLRRTFEINFFAAVGLVQGYAPQMVTRGYGRIVNVSSGMGRLRDADGLSFAYRSSKLALNSLTLTLSRRLAQLGGGVAAFSYCPGWIRTEMGTANAPGRPDDAAAALVRLLDVPAHLTNGRFFRRERELAWDV